MPRQGVEAQTLANLYLALEHDLDIIPVINKIDLPSADPDAVAAEIEELLGVPAEEVLRVSAKDGTGVEALLEAIIERIRPPAGEVDEPLRALVFDSHYDSYKGVIAYVRVFGGTCRTASPLMIMSNGRKVEPLEVGVFAPDMRPVDSLSAGDVGYVATGLKTVRDCRVGDTLTGAQQPAAEPLPGFDPPKPMVFAGLYPVENDDYSDLRDALEKLQLNDASLVYQPESSVALNMGFRCGFLGLLHMEIVQERLEREYELDLLATAPSVEYQVVRTNGEIIEVDNPADLPGHVADRRDPRALDADQPLHAHGLYRPADGTGHRSPWRVRQDGVSGRQARGICTLQIPLSEILVDFHDQLKSCVARLCLDGLSLFRVSRGDLVKMDDPGERRPCGRALDHRAPRERLRQGQPAGAPAEGSHPAAAVPGADSGGRGRTGDRARHGQGCAQGRARQVLWRRHHAQAQAAGEAERRPPPPQEGGQGRVASRGLYDCTAAQRLTTIVTVRTAPV